MKDIIFHKSAASAKIDKIKDILIADGVDPIRLDISDGGNKLYIVSFDGRGWDLTTDWMFVNARGKNAFGDKTWCGAMPFAEGLAAVCQDTYDMDGKWGFINTNGQLVIDYLFDKVTSSFSNGKARVVLNGASCTIDKNGNVVTE